MCITKKDSVDVGKGYLEHDEHEIDGNDLRSSEDMLMLIHSMNHRTKNLINIANLINNLSQKS
jgi:hypothetical protein